MSDSLHIPILICNFHTCNPKLCTATRMVRFHKAREIKISQIRHRSIVLTPFSKIALSPSDRSYALEYGLVGVDCSWNNIEAGMNALSKGQGRALPFLVAANSINYGVPTKLSTLEAIGAALYILGAQEQAKEIFSLVKWGPEFLKINKPFLDAYSQAKDSKEVIAKQKVVMTKLYGGG